MTGLWRVSLQSLDRPTNQSNHLHQVNGTEIPSSTYMRWHLSQYKTHGQKPSIGVTSTHGRDSRQKTFTRWINLRPPSRSISNRALKNPDQQQPERLVENTRGTHIQSKNQITTRQSLWWPKWENSQYIHWPDRKIPNYVHSGQQLYTDHVCILC